MKHATQAMLTMMITAASLVGCGKLEKAATSKDVRDANGSGGAATKPTLNLSGAIALAVKGAGSSLALASEPDVVSSTNLMKVSSDGSLSSAFTSYNPNIHVSKVWIVKNHVFLLFKDSIPMIPGEDKTTVDTCWDGSPTVTPPQCPTMPTCLLGYADVSDGVVKCVNPGLTYLTEFRSGKSSVQFDDAGNLFYAGTVNKTTANGAIIAYNVHRKAGIDRWDASTKAITTNSNPSSDGFIVFSNGDTWQTDGTNAGSITSASGKTVKSLSGFGWAMKFPDGNTYASSGAGLVKLDADYNYTLVKSGQVGGYPSLSASGKVLTISNADSKFGKVSVYKVFPEYKAFDLSVINKAIPTAIGNGTDILQAYAGNSLIVAGTDSSGNYHLTSFDVESEKETDLLPNNQVHILSMASTATSVVFSGEVVGASLDDGATGNVMGQVDLKTGQVSLKSGATTVTQVQTIKP
jgi:hypothetical protein